MLPRLGRALLVVVLVGLGVAAGPADPAAACSCKVASTADHYASADVVFTGRLLERTVDEPITSSIDPARHVFAVDRAWKGDVPERATVLSAVSGASCGLELRGTGPFVVFAREKDAHLESGLCTGTAELRPALAAELDALAPAPAKDPPAALSPAAAPTTVDTDDPLPAAGLLAGAAGLVVLALAAPVVLRRRR
jgi:hypothetical protein